MAAMSHGTSAKRMTDVHAALRRDLRLSRNRSDLRSREAMTAWRPKSRAGADRSRPRAGGAGRAQREPLWGCGGPARTCQAIMVPCPLHRCAKASLWKCPLHAMCGSMLILLGFSEIAHCGAKMHIAPSFRYCLVSPTFDRAAMCGFYLAIARSSVRRSAPAIPVRSFAKLRSEKIRPSTLAAGSPQVHCSRDAGSLVAARASRVARSSEARTQSCGGLCRFFADRKQERERQTALGRTW